MQMKNRIGVTCIVFLFVVYSCGSSQRDKALTESNEAKVILEQGDTLKAIEMFEAIPLQYPKAKVQVGVSKNIIDDLYRQLIDNRKAQLAATDRQIGNLEKNFVKEKTEFDLYVQYIPKQLSSTKSWNRSFIQVNLDERGEIFLTSHYMGKDWLRHTAIRVYDEEIEAKTPDVPLSDPNNRESDFLEYKWEKVAYMNGKSDEVIKFIVDNKNRDLKCVYIGSNYYYIILEDFNKDAISNAFFLSQAIKRKAEINRQIKELEAKRD